MKQFLFNLLKWFLIVTCVALVAVLVFGGVLLLHWPWWIGCFIITGMVGVFLGVIFVRKLLLRRREQNFVHQVIEQDESYRRSLGKKEKKSSQELQDRWKEAMDALRHSHLKKRGNPLYVLPWYMIVGESGSGKTTAIKSANLSSPFAEISRTSGISGTRNCDWWFFEQAIIIDTAGRYAIPVDEGRDKDEWQKFLSLLAKFRRKEPLNGLVVTIAADKLLNSTVEELDAAGKSIRRRVDELSRVLGATFPVYILVTKCDLIQGTTQFCDRLTEKNQEQAMGAVNTEGSTHTGAVVDAAVNTISDRLREIRLLLFEKPDPKGFDPALLIYPEEFEKIKPGLAAFTKGAFQENPYQETPHFRGLFFSSGHQEGTPYSHFLKDLGLIEEKEVLPGTSKGLFLHDFFSRILPGDRGLFSLTQRAVEWKRLTRNMGLTSWIAIIIALCGLLSFSFVKNLKTLRDVSTEFQKPPVLQGELLPDIVTMDRFRQAVLKVEAQNKRWWIPRFGLDQSREIEGQLKEKYCAQFRSGFLQPFEKRMTESMTHFSAATPQAVIGSHVAYLVKRINLLRARMAGEDLSTLQTHSQPVFDLSSADADQALIPDMLQQISHLNLYYLLWQQDTTGLNQEMSELQNWLKHVLTLKGVKLNWLAEWINADPAYNATTFAEFWGEGLEDPDGTIIPPAFTVEGKTGIDAFLAEIETALFDPLLIASQKAAFQSWYRESYFRTWYVFAAAFLEVPDRMKDMEQVQEAGIRMATAEGPYFSLLTRLSQELDPMLEGEFIPEWVDLVGDVEGIRLQAKMVAKSEGKKPGILKKAAGKVSKTISKTERALGTKVAGSLSMEKKLLAGKAFATYEGAVEEMKTAYTSRNVAFQTTTDVFSGDAATSKIPFYTAMNALGKLSTMLKTNTTETKTIWRLMSGPKDFLYRYMVKETGCYLQEVWERDTLMELQEVSDSKNMNQLLMGEGGLALKFINGPAAPFLSRSVQKGYYAKTVYGRQVDINKNFFIYLTKGAKAAKHVKENYKVVISADPTGANRDAQIKPHMTMLELQCAKGKTQLVNQNYPVKETFLYSPQSCGDVVFKIEVGDIVLNKKYTGFNAFPKFLKDFERGKRVFFPKEFPDKQQALKRIGVKYITVRYKLDGHKPVLKLLRSAPGKVPQWVAACWGS